MHSSFALTGSAFSVERHGAPAPLSTLWPDGYQARDRMAVLLCSPMDAIGCSNLISGTVTQFYDHMRATRGEGRFFRYCEHYVIGVGCDPGDYNQLDIWPPHKMVTIVDPTPERVLETLLDRAITLLALPESGLGLSGPVVLSTWNAFGDWVRAAVAYSPSGRARRSDVALVGNRVVESYVEQAIFSTPGVGADEQARLRHTRRALDRQPMVCEERYRTLVVPEGCRTLLGVGEVLPPGHQAD